MAGGEDESNFLLPGSVAPEEFGSTLQYFTGAQAHNVRLRGRALRMGLTLNEYGLFSIADGERVAGETEEGIYEALGLRWIPPELREDRGEIDDAVIVALDVMGKPARTRERA